jgi:transposase-like protein
MARRWTPEEYERLRRRYAAGASLAAIARDLGRSQDAVDARRAAVGLHPCRALRMWSALAHAIVTAANQAGLPATTVARQLRRPA